MNQVVVCRRIISFSCDVIACIVEAHESTRQRLESSLPKDHGGRVSLSFSCCRLHRNFQLSLCVFDGCYACQPSSIVEFWFLVYPFLLFSLLCGFSVVGPHFRSHILRSNSSLNFFQSPPGPHLSLWRFLLSIR